MKKILILMVLLFASQAQARMYYGDWYVTGDLSVGTIGAYLVDGSALFDDSATDTDHGWTASKIQAVVDAGGVLPPVTDKQMLQANGTTLEATSVITGIGYANLDEIADYQVNSTPLFDDSAADTGHGLTASQINARISAGDSSAIHKSVANEISVITLKTTPTAADSILIEDAADSNNKKRILIGSLPGDSTAWTEQGSDPTYDTMSTGDKIVSTSSGDLFYKSATGFYTIAGSYAIDPTLYTLTVTDPGNNDAITCTDSDLSQSINCGNGNSICTATAVNGANITGMTAVADTGRQFDNWTGDIGGSENPTTTPLVMSTNRDVQGVFSVISTGNHFRWEMENTYVAEEGYDSHVTFGSPTFGTTAPPQGTYFLDLAANADIVRFDNISNIDANSGYISLYIASTDLSTDTFLLELKSSDNDRVTLRAAYGDLILYHYSHGLNRRTSITGGSTTYADGTWRFFELAWVQGTSLTIKVDTVDLSEALAGTWGGDWETIPTSVQFRGSPVSDFDSIKVRTAE